MERSYLATSVSPRPIEQVWKLLADTGNWSVWGPGNRSSVVTPGEPAPNGVGSVFRVGLGPLIDTYETIVVEEPHHLAYKLVKGLPIRGFRANVELAENSDGGTDIKWSAKWDRSPLPAAFWRRILHLGGTQAAKALAKA